MSIKKIPVEIQAFIKSSSHIINFTTAIQELIYNSIDAESTSIAVRINLEEYNMLVIDNGCGVSKKDMEVIGNRYMTSKLTNIEDVRFALKTYGHRGETLASLIELSDECIFTSRAGHSTNTYCKIFKGSNISNVELTKDRPSPGLTVHIKGFMHKLPIRRNNLNIPTELHNMKNAIECIALIHQSKSFSIRDDTNNDVVVKMPKTKTLQQSLKNIYGTDIGSMLQELQVEKKYFKVKAYISKDLSINLNLRIIYLNKYPLINSKLHKIVNGLLLKCSRSNNNEACGGKFMKMKRDYKNAQPVYENVDKSKRSYIILISCPYYCYDLSNISNKTLVEFHEWSRITNLLEKLVNFFSDSIKIIPIESAAKTLPQPKNILLQGEQLNKAVNKIVDKVLKSNKKKFGVSQVPNAVKGKIAKRRKMKIKRQNVLKLKVTQTEKNGSRQQLDKFPITKPVSVNNGQILSIDKNIPNKMEVCVSEKGLRETPFEMPDDNRHKQEIKFINQKKHNQKLCSRKMLNYKKIAKEARDLMKKEKDKCLVNFKKTTAIKRTCIREMIIIRKKINKSRNYKIKSFKTNYDLIKPALQIFNNNLASSNFQTTNGLNQSNICHVSSNEKNIANLISHRKSSIENNYVYSISKNTPSFKKSLFNDGLFMGKNYKQKSRNIIDNLMKTYTNISYLCKSHQNTSDKSRVQTNTISIDEIKTKKIGDFLQFRNCKKNIKKHNEHFMNTVSMKKFGTQSYDIQWSSSANSNNPPKNYKYSHYINRPINMIQQKSTNIITNNFKVGRNFPSNNLQNNRPSKLFEVSKIKKIYAKKTVPAESNISKSQMDGSMKSYIYDTVVSSLPHNESSKLMPFRDSSNLFNTVPDIPIRNLIQFNNQKVETNINENLLEDPNKTYDVDNIFLTYNSHIVRNKDDLKNHSHTNSEKVPENTASPIDICKRNDFIEDSIDNSSKLDCAISNSRMEVIFISTPEGKRKSETIMSNDLNPTDFCEPIIGSSDLFENSIIITSNDKNDNKSIIEANNVTSTKATNDFIDKVKTSMETTSIDNIVLNSQNKKETLESDTKENECFQIMKGHNESFKLMPFRDCSNLFNNDTDIPIRNLIKFNNQKVETNIKENLIEDPNKTYDVDNIFLTYNSHILRNKDELKNHSHTNSAKVPENTASPIDICKRNDCIEDSIDNFSKLDCAMSNSRMEVIFIATPEDKRKSETIMSNDLNPTDFCEPVIGSSDLFENSVIITSNDKNNNKSIIEANNVTSTKATNDFIDKVKTSMETTSIDNIVLNSQNKMETLESDTKNNECFQIMKRLIYVPKGMSPIFQGPSIRNLVKRNNETYTTTDQYFSGTMYDNFVNDVNKYSEVYETNAPFVDEVTDERIRNACYRLRELVSRSTFHRSCLENTVVLKQVDNKFLTVILKDSTNKANFYVTLFDQHAVHERITLEKLFTEYKTDDRKWKSKNCDPFEIKLSDFDTYNLAYYKDKFMLHGLRWEHSENDSNSIIITEVPICLLKRNELGADCLKGLIKDLIDELLVILKNTKGCGIPNTRNLMKIVNMEACRSAIKFGQNLTKSQCVKLIADLSKCNTPFQCAHGRPSLAVLIKLREESSNYKVDKQKVKCLLKPTT